MLKKLLIIIALLFTPFLSGAQEQKHQFRIGWGDMMYEHAVYSPSAKHIFEDISKIPENYRVKEL
ncbi:MAG: hypothetical protein IKZ51_06550, partial [Bacteroidales bacterium]|nr:hypothetical protein [Bacteroidales bacterium]